MLTLTEIKAIMVQLWNAAQKEPRRNRRQALFEAYHQMAQVYDWTFINGVEPTEPLTE